MHLEIGKRKKKRGRSIFFFVRSIPRNISGITSGLTFAISVTTETQTMLALFIEDLDAMVWGIGDDNGIIRTHGNASWPREKSGLGSSWSEC